MDVPPDLLAAANDRQAGASQIALQAVGGLLEVAADPARLAAAVEVLLAGQPAMAPIWHLARAARAPDPAAALTRLRGRLLTETDDAVAAAAGWLDAQVDAGVPVATVSYSSLVERVLAGRPRATPDAPDDPAAVAVIGADAVGPAAVLNARGSAELAARLPTLVVATSVKLVPAEVFERLAAPGFERVPLERLAAVVLGPRVVTPAEAGRRATAA